MAHITLSIPDEMYKEMKKHPEIKWSEAARRGIRRQLANVGGVISGKELIERLPSDSREAFERISKLPVSDWQEHYKKMKESEQKRLKSLTRTS